MRKRVLCVLGEGFEEIEAITPIDLLRRAGVDVVLASVSGDSLVMGRSNIVLQTEIALSRLQAADFDMLLLPGGPGVAGLRKEGRAVALAKEFSAAEKLIAAICAAPTILHDAGLLEGKRFTAHVSVHGELPGALGDERVVQDGKIITSRGAGTALDFGLALVAELCGPEKRDEIAQSIMA